MGFYLLLMILLKKISKYLSSKRSSKHFDHSKNVATNAFKTASKRAIQKTAKPTGILKEIKLPIKLYVDQILNPKKTTIKIIKKEKEQFISKFRLI